MPLVGQVNVIRSVSWPWERSGSFPDIVRDADVVASNLNRLYSTEIGEDKTEPAFGVEFLKFVFETTGIILEQMMAAEIVKRTLQWEPRAQITSIDVKTTDEETNGVTIVDIYVEWEFAGIKGQTIQAQRSRITGSN